MPLNFVYSSATRLGSLCLDKVHFPLRRFSCSKYHRFATKAVLRPNIAVVGGGHAGVSVALRLASLPWTRLTKPQITIVDKSDRFCFLPMLYELALGQVEKWEIAPKFEDLLEGSSIQYLQGDVDNLNLTDGVVEGTHVGKNSSFRLPFDRALLALGAQAAGISSVPGAKEFAYPFYALSDAIRLKEKLKSLKKAKSPGEVINVIVVGAGFSGIEIASCLSEDFGTAGSVLVVEPSDQILNKATDFNRKTAEKALAFNGAVIEYHSQVTEVESDSVTLRKRNNGEETTSKYPADLVVWTAGSTPNTSLQNFGIPLNSSGRISTDSMLQVQGHVDKLYSLGDNCAVSKDDGYYGTAQVAVQQAEYAAWNAWASLTGKPKLEYRYAHLGEMMVLGSMNATVTTSVGVQLEGTAAWASRRVAYLARIPTERHRLKVAASWAVHPLLNGISDLVAQNREYRNKNV